jgi:hypothetical protein
LKNATRVRPRALMGAACFNHNKMVFKLDCVIQITPMPVLAQKLKCSKRGDVVRFLI